MRVIHASKAAPAKKPAVVERKITSNERPQSQTKPLSQSQKRLISEPIDFLSMEIPDERAESPLFDDENLNKPLGHLAKNINHSSENFSLTNLKNMIEELKEKPQKRRSTYRLASTIQSKRQHEFTAEDAVGIISVDRILHSDSESKTYEKSKIRNYPDSLLNLPGNRAKNARASLPLTFA